MILSSAIQQLFPVSGVSAIWPVDDVTQEIECNTFEYADLLIQQVAKGSLTRADINVQVECPTGVFLMYFDSTLATSGTVSLDEIDYKLTLTSVAGYAFPIKLAGDVCRLQLKQGSGSVSGSLYTISIVGRGSSGAFP